LTQRKRRRYCAKKVLKGKGKRWACWFRGRRQTQKGGGKGKILKKKKTLEVDNLTIGEH